MKIISPTVHGIIDYLVVVFLLLSPSIFGIGGGFGTFLYVLAGIHFLLTIFTNFRYGFVKIIPFRMHGWIELVVSVVLVLMPFLFGFEKGGKPFIFSIAFGIAVFVVWLLSNYK